MGDILGRDTRHLMKHRFSGDPWGPCSKCWHESAHPIHEEEENEEELGGKLEPPQLCDCCYLGGEVSSADTMCLRCPSFTKTRLIEVSEGG